MRSIVTVIGVNAIIQLSAATVSTYALVHTFGWLATLGIFAAGSVTGGLSALLLARS